MVGGGGALLREKMVEVVSDKFICIVDESKLSKVSTQYSSLLISYDTLIPSYFPCPTPSYLPFFISFLSDVSNLIIRSYKHVPS
jgi:hypothetical protein